VILGKDPGHVQTVVEDYLPRPRDYRSPEFLGMVDRLHELITGHELPDVPAAVAPGAPAAEPLPHAHAGEIIGLLEYLDARGGREDVFRIAGDTNRDFGYVINIVQAAEMLNFVDTPRRMVVLDRPGQRLVQATADERKALFREQLLALGLFKAIHATLRRAPGHCVDRDFVLETIILRMPQEHPEEIFETFISWARFGNLFAYDETTETISLQEEVEAPSSPA